MLIGVDVATRLRLKEDETLELLGRKFTVTAILPQLVQWMILASLHTCMLFNLSKKGSVISAIEVIGCCQEIFKGLVSKINSLLPDAKVVTITQIADSQIKINHMMSSLSTIFLVIIIFVGGASIANYMYANVFERRKEIGTLMALGADSRLVLKMFLLKALLMGAAGGVGGYILGTILAVVLGPILIGVIVWPMPLLALLAVSISVALALVASYFPARRAARLDPCATFQEV